MSVLSYHLLSDAACVALVTLTISSCARSSSPTGGSPASQAGTSASTNIASSLEMSVAPTTSTTPSQSGLVTPPNVSTTARPTAVTTASRGMLVTPTYVSTTDRPTTAPIPDPLPTGLPRVQMLLLVSSGVGEG